VRPAGILHPGLLEVLARAGHGDVIVLAEAGLKIPRGATPGVRKFGRSGFQGNPQLVVLA
jgi:hypothetical protein